MTKNTQPTRRAIFRGVALTSIAARLAARSALASPTAPPDAAADANQDAELIRLCAAFDRLECAWWNLHDGGAHPIEDDDERAIALAPLEAQQDPIAALIWATEARTMAGVRAKARSWLLFSPEILAEVSSWDDRFRASIIRDLVGTAVVDALTDETELPATINYRRGPPYIAMWAEVSAAEFPWFGMAEVMLTKSDAELADAWRELPEASQRTAKIFQQIGARWLDGAEAMAVMIQRMTRARDTIEAEKAVTAVTHEAEGGA